MSTRNIFTRSLVFNKGERERERVVASFPIFSLLHMCHQYFLQYLPAQSLWIKVAIKCLPGVGSLSILSSGDRCCTMLTFCNNITYKWTSSAKIISHLKCFVLQMQRERLGFMFSNLSSPLHLRSILNSNNSSLFLMTKYANFARVEGDGLQGNYLEI